MKAVRKPEMTAEQFTRWMSVLGLNSTTAAEALGITRQQANNYASGRARIKRPVLLACRYLYLCAVAKVGKKSGDKKEP